MDDKLMHLCRSLLVAVFTAVVARMLRSFLSRSKVRLPPGPWKLPVIGSMHHLVNVLPHRALRDLSGIHGPLMMLQLGETPLVVASSREMARQVLKTHDANFATRPKLLSGEIVLYGWSDILFSPSGDYWRKLRQLCTAEILSPKRVLTFRRIREEEMAREVDRIRATGPSTPVNLTMLFHNLAISVISRASFGNKHRNIDEYLAAVRTGVTLSSGFKIPDLFPTWKPLLARVTGLRRALEGVHRTVDAILEEIVEERRRALDEKASCGRLEAEAENLVDVLIGQQRKGGLGFDLTKNRIKCLIFDMFTAGSGTLASTLSWGMSELMRNKRVMARLQGEIRETFRGKATVSEADIQSSSLPYLRFVIKETFRLHPPAPLLVPRESTEACEIEGYTVPAGSRVVVNAWAIGRDEKYWENPDEFRPERFLDSTVDFTGTSYELLPFGAGRRMCPGITYAFAILDMVLVQLLYHFDWSLPEGVTELSMEEGSGLGVHRKFPLLLRATPLVVNAACHESV